MKKQEHILKSNTILFPLTTNSSLIVLYMRDTEEMETM